MTPERIGPYRILEKIGSGGMGHVYLGVRDEPGAEEGAGEKVAIKVLTASLARESGFVERFNREIDSMRKLENPHVVKLLDSGADGENYYYAMEFVPGETLLGVMRREKRIPWQRAVEIAIQICQALKAAHDTGIIHRDLKPSNLLVTPEGLIKLTDFGVAQVFASNRLTVTGGIIGTAEYMSPEQAQGKRAGKQSDLYSLGALLYAMITGRPPFSGSTAVEVIQKHKFGLFDRPSLLVSDLPKKVEDTICRLLEKDPAKRFPDAFVLLRHLEQLLRAEEYATHGVTLADFSAVDSAARTLVATEEEDEPRATSPGTSAQSGPATLMQGLMRAELEQMNRGDWVSALFNSLVVQVTLLALVVGGGVWWFWPKTVSPQEQFEQGVALMQKPAGPGWNEARRKYFDPLIAAAPETWSESVKPYLRQIELYELTRSTRGGKRAKAGETQTESERLLHLALHFKEIGDVPRAERTLVALQTLLEGNEDEARIHDFAGLLLEDLRQLREKDDGRNRFLRSNLERATRLAKEGQEDPAKAAEAREIWNSIIELDSGDSSSVDFVTQAREALSRQTTPR